MLTLYVAGRYRDEGTYFVEQNIRAAESVAIELVQMGCAVICPHTLCRHWDGPLTNEQIMQMDFELLTRCDGIVLLPSYVDSEGSQRELALAIQLGLPVLHWPKDKVAVHLVSELNRAYYRGFDAQSVAGCPEESRPCRG